jgi:IclR family transcriptional regulator, KDG regulon repressor
VAIKGKIRQCTRHVEAVLAACDIVDSFLCIPNQTLKQIIDQTRLTRNRVMRLTGTLEARQYLLRDSMTGTYSLGPRIMSLGRVYERQSNLVSLAKPILRKLASTTGESAFVYVLDNTDCVVLAREEGTSDVRLVVDEGQRIPIHLGASGKVLLAFGPKEAREKVLNSRYLSKQASGAIIDPLRLSDDLNRVKTQGFAFSRGERIPDAAGIVAPIFGLENCFLGALGIAGPIHRFTPEILPERIKFVMTAAAELTRKSGGFPALPSKSNRRLESSSR